MGLQGDRFGVRSGTRVERSVNCRRDVVASSEVFMRHPPCHAPSSSIASIIRCRLFPACSFTAAHQNARFTKTPQLASWGAAAGSGTHTTSTCNELLASHSALVNTESKGGAAAGGRDVVMLMAFQLLSHITPHARRPNRGSTSCTAAARPDRTRGRPRAVVARARRAPGTYADQDDTNKPSES